MTRISLPNGVTLFHADCRDALRSLPDNSIDAVPCDPPYELNFMGKGWDDTGIANDPALWAEVLRVLKPGGHLAAFSASRTYHRMACAIEDAGFEIRDSLMWIYGTGFPKSHDVSKGIDRAGGISPRDQAALLRERREAAGVSREGLAAAIGCTVSSVRDWEEGRARATGAAIEWLVPSDKYRAKLAKLLGYSTDERELIGVALDRRGDETVIGLGHSGALRTGGHTAAAAEWEGWGTALKPAFEPIVLARKPLSEGTVAANVLRWGTGALNIDACRVGLAEGETPYSYPNGAGGNTFSVAKGIDGTRTEPVAGNAAGRWPANVVHDGSDEVIAAFPTTAPSRIGKPRGAAAGEGWGMTQTGAEYSDSGSAARFFYSAKASKADRAGSKHPTVKPISLMEWLAKLITPPQGVILDPFAGSGTTGAAAVRAGFRAILCEREDEYVTDIKRRLGNSLDAQIAADHEARRLLTELFPA
ncbi:DNA methyltransferase [Bradyrhizobium sp. HKCCYLS2038]|uniref:DNA methyltransferase n=1 Tax=Bradyrhizobium sp. HKCCYLS2038 TaxID=3420764 RepID=UPI003EBAB74A